MRESVGSGTLPSATRVSAISGGKVFALIGDGLAFWPSLPSPSSSPAILSPPRLLRRLA